MSSAWRSQLADAELERVMLRYASARDAIVEQLRRDALLHEAERYDEIGRRFDAVEHAFPSGSAPELIKLRVALTFWDAWIDARNLGWPSSGIEKASWPLLARAIAEDLGADREISDPAMRARFDFAGSSSPPERVRALANRLQRD